MKNYLYITGIVVALLALSTKTIMLSDGYEKTTGYMQYLIAKEAKHKKLDPALALAVADVESTFNPDAERPEPKKNSVSLGLFQMFLPTAKDMGFKGVSQELKNPEVNVHYGVEFLYRCQKKFGHDVRKIACCHNAGLYRKAAVCQSDGWVIHYQDKVQKAYQKYLPLKKHKPLTTASL